jgi:hypothetical protein
LLNPAQALTGGAGPRRRRLDGARGWPELRLSRGGSAGRSLARARGCRRKDRRGRAAAGKELGEASCQAGGRPEPLAGGGALIGWRWYWVWRSSGQRRTAGAQPTELRGWGRVGGAWATGSRRLRLSAEATGCLVFYASTSVWSALMRACEIMV